MSDAQHTTAPASAPEIPITAEQTAAQQPETTTAATTEETPKTEPAAATTETPITDASKTETTDAAAPAEEKKDEPAAEKTVEPITEGVLAYKGPGLLKSLIPSKKEFWLTDDSFASKDLSSYMRGEKPDVANPVAAWATQSGKGLLFFGKKGEVSRKQPGGILALYDATDLRKQSPHDIVFKLNGHEHTLKASSEAERDGWFMSLEKSVEMGKASKDEIREGEGYKEEFEKLTKPSTGGAAAAAAVPKKTEAQPKKSTEVDQADKVDKPADAQRANSEAEEGEKKNKSRSTSRGMLGKLKGKKEDVEHKKEEKKEQKEEQKTDKEIEEAVTVPTDPKKVEENKKEAAEEAAAEEAKAEEQKPTEEKPKPAKRSSIFGKMPWGGVKSPSKEKDQKDAELKPEADKKEPAAVSDSPPQLSDPTTATTPGEEVTETAKPDGETKPEVPEKKDEVATPNKEKSGFLSSFMKRGRSVSPSAGATEKKDEEAPKEAPKDEEVKPTEPLNADEPTKTEEPAAVPATTEPTEKAEKAEEISKADSEKAEKKPEQNANKRSSMFGGLGRRASKAINRISHPQKKENEAPTAATTSEPTKEEAETPASADKPAAVAPATEGETKHAEAESKLNGTDAPASEALDAQPTQQQQPAPAVVASA